jgi:predicted nuclease of predicted toxin-antitoxin system
MKLLFDHNLSYKLVGRLADLVPDSEHVRNVNLHEADDRTVWEYTRANGFAIVSKEEDFHQLAFSMDHRLKWFGYVSETAQLRTSNKLCGVIIQTY